MFSPDGSKFAAAYCGVINVYDVASRARLAEFFFPSAIAAAAWAPDGRHVMVSWEEGACVWDFSRPEAPSIITVDVGPDACLHGWSPSGASYFVVRELEGRAPNGQATRALEERRAGGSLIRAVSLGPGEFHRDGSLPNLCLSPDAHALLLDPFGGGATRVLVFE